MTRRTVTSFEILDKLQELHPHLKSKVSDYIDTLLQSPENQQIIEGIPPVNDIGKKELLLHKDNSPGLKPIPKNPEEFKNKKS